MKICIIPILNTISTIPVEYEIQKNSMFMNCVLAANSGNILKKYDKIIFGIYTPHEDKYNVSERIKNDIHCIEKMYTEKFMCEVKFIFIDLPTPSMAATVMEIISKSDIHDNDELFIKDADNYWTSVDFFNVSGNFVTVASLENLNLVDTTHKSYIKTDEQGFITNCIEKKVISDKFIAGGYSFANVNLFTEAYENLNSIGTVFYISDMIFWLILYCNEKFRPVSVDNFKDYNIIK